MSFNRTWSRWFLDFDRNFIWCSVGLEVGEERARTGRAEAEAKSEAELEETDGGVSSNLSFGVNFL